MIFQKEKVASDRQILFVCIFLPLKSGSSKAQLHICSYLYISLSQVEFLPQPNFFFHTKKHVFPFPIPLPYHKLFFFFLIIPSEINFVGKLTLEFQGVKIICFASPSNTSLDYLSLMCRILLLLLFSDVLPYWQTFKLDIALFS